MWLRRRYVSVRHLAVVAGGNVYNNLGGKCSRTGNTRQVGEEGYKSERKDIRSMHQASKM